MSSIIGARGANWTMDDTARSGVPAAARAFAAGLFRVSPLAATVCLSVVAVGVGAFLLLVTPHSLTAFGRTGLASHRTDYDAIATADLQAFLEAPVPSSTLVLLGGSTMRASLLEADVTAALADAGARMRLLKLCTSSQTLWESLAFADRLPRRMGGVAAIGVGASLFSRGDDVLRELAAAPRLGLRAPMLDEALASHGLPVGPRTGVYAIDNASFLVARRQALAARLIGMTPLPHVDSQYTGRATTVTPAVWQKMGERVAGRYRDMDRHWTTNAEVLTRLVHVLQERGLAVVLVETPVNPRFEAEFDGSGAAARHRARMQQLSARLGAPYLDLRSAARLTPPDFHDWAHLRAPDAARRCARALAMQVRALVRERQAA